MESNEPIAKQSRNERIEVFLRERYEFRFNTVKSRTEFRVGGNGAFLPVTKFYLNSIRRELDRTTGINTPAVKYRRPYDVYIEEYPHLASFMASVNGNDFLTDPTGSRRFLPFEVVAIDIQAAKAINMDEVYSEAISLYENGFRYWFNDEEIEELHRQSSAFHVQTIEYEMLLQGFEQPSEHATADCFMTTVQVMSYLKAYTSLQLSEKRMGEALRKAGFVRISKRVNGSKNPMYGWIIKKIVPNPFVSYDL